MGVSSPWLIIWNYPKIRLSVCEIDDLIPYAPSPLFSSQIISATIREWETSPSSSPHSYSRWCFHHPPVLLNGRRWVGMWVVLPSMWILRESKNTMGMFIGGIWWISWNQTNMGICLLKYIPKVTAKSFGLNGWVFRFTKDRWVVGRLVKLAIHHLKNGFILPLTHQ